MDAFEWTENASLSQNPFPDQIDEHVRQTIAVLIWIDLYSKKWSDDLMIKEGCNDFRAEEAAHHDGQETISKVHYDFQSDCPITKWKISVHQDYSWVQNILKNDVNLDHALCKI